MIVSGKKWRLLLSTIGLLALLVAVSAGCGKESKKTTDGGAQTARIVGATH